jgi:hypothetical protein
MIPFVMARFADDAAKVAVVAAVLALAGCGAKSGQSSGSAPDGGADVATVFDAADASSDLPPLGPASVLQHHNSGTRDGLYVDAKLTRTAAAGMHRDPTFAATYTGLVWAQPLYLDLDATGAKDLLVVATHQNEVSAFEAGTGHVAWRRVLGTPVPVGTLGCGDINPVGVTGTPVVEASTRTLYLDAMTTTDGGATKHHLVFALSIDDGRIRAGWPVDLGARAHFGTLAFDAGPHNERGALALAGGRVFIPFGGHAGDCGEYRGWVIGVSTTDPTDVVAWATGAKAGGIWGPSGVATDGTSVFVATGNSIGATAWSAGESIVRLPPSLVFSGRANDFYTPASWQDMDVKDQDLGSSGVVLVDPPDGRHLAVAVAKDQAIHVVDRTNLGGFPTTPLGVQITNFEIVGAPAAYTTPNGTFVVTHGFGIGCPPGQEVADVVGVALPPDGPPHVAWCAREIGFGSPIVTTPDGQRDFIVWAVGSDGDGQLHGFDAENGAIVYAGGAEADAVHIRRFQSPIVAKGRMFVATDSGLVAFTP